MNSNELMKWLLILSARGGGGGVTPEQLAAGLALKTDKVSSAIAGNLAALDGNGNLMDSGVPLSIVNGALCITFDEVIV